MQQAKEKAGEADRLSKEHAQALEILNAMEENTGSDKESGDLLEKMNKFAAGMQKISKENADLKAALDAMASAAVPDVPWLLYKKGCLFLVREAPKSICSVSKTLCSTCPNAGIKYLPIRLLP